jgi:3-oxoacyl-[acyl-carrier protein] reductase
MALHLVEPAWGQPAESGTDSDAPPRILSLVDLGIRDRRAMVGGASSGIGEAIAERLAAEGCSLLVWARGAERLEAVAARLRERYGVEVATAAVDAGAHDAPDRLEQAAQAALGGIDICVLNAGGPAPVDPLATTADGWQSAFGSLATNPVLLASRLMGPMRERRWGRIVACLSWSVKEPIANLVYSNAGRSALGAWLKTVAPIVAPDGVTVNGILTGPTDTPRIDALDRDRAEREGRDLADVRAEREASIPAGRLGRPAELASLAAYLCSESAAFQTGTFTLVDGGLVRSL